MQKYLMPEHEVRRSRPRCRRERLCRGRRGATISLAFLGQRRGGDVAFPPELKSTGKHFKITLNSSVRRNIKRSDNLEHETNSYHCSAPLGYHRIRV